MSARQMIVLAALFAGALVQGSPRASAQTAADDTAKPAETAKPATAAAPAPTVGATPAAKAPGPSPATPPAPAPGPPPETSAVVLDRSAMDGVIGRNVTSVSGEAMGHVVDVLVMPSGEVRAAVLDFGGVLGVGSRKVAVSWKALSFANLAKDGAVQVLLTRNQVRVAPEYKAGDPVVVLEPTPEPPPATVAPKSDVAVPKSNAAAPKSDVLVPKSEVAAPKSDVPAAAAAPQPTPSVPSPR